MFRRREVNCFIGAGGRHPFAKAELAYLHNLLVSTSLRRLQHEELSMLEDLGQFLRHVEKTLGYKAGIDLEEAMGASERPRVRARLGAWLKRDDEPKVVPPPGQPVQRNIALVGRVLDIDQPSLQILTFLLAVRLCPELRKATLYFGELTHGAAAAIVAVATQLPVATVQARLEAKARLRATGLVALDPDPEDLLTKLGVRNRLFDVVQSTRLSAAALLGTFVAEAPAPTLAWDDYAHVEATLGMARDLLRAALKHRARGVNVLFHGPTGTGKTEAARLIASSLGATLYVTGKDVEPDAKTPGADRFASLKLANELAPARKTMLLFDEMEDLFGWNQSFFFGPPRAEAQTSKLGLVDHLESNPIPTIWISNRIAGIDPALLRRFGYAVEFRQPGSRRRAEILLKHFGNEIELSRADAEGVTSRYETSPAQLASAVRAAKLLSNGKPTRELLEQVLAPVERVLGGRAAGPAPFDPSRFRLDAVNASEDLEALVARLEGWKPSRDAGLSLCLHGPPGTGKSELVRYLAWRMGRPVVAKRVSDLESKWVGETEANIAEAFAEAKNDDAVLLLDEADSFLRSRMLAAHSWETTRVNELLQQLEAFTGVVACTTNLVRDLDEASLRRFVFKIEMRYLRAEQAVVMFRSFFPEAAAGVEDGELRRELARGGPLALGDFAVVARRLRATEAVVPAGEILRLLQAEARLRSMSARPVGF